ncbi:hypothetical protein [Chitinophaga flava]|uniref:Lipoprotein n=1 Tax=Chitinophaga flava TaxID=2259036 RepID=A0A365XZ90_9BACT|nr:hypothetical protein [Chitinophaga flava]RBL91667.1 hypothetical protein DF182_03370 [Chitinophaga flava]
MKTLQILSFVAVGALASCGQSGNQSGNQANKNTDSVKTPATFTEDICYQKANGKDTTILELHKQDTLVVGQLFYNRFEKDKNAGAIAGVIRNNYIFGQYSFMSEGTMSSRPVIFHLVGDKAYEAVTDSINRVGVLVFSNDTTALKFEAEPLLKISCDKIGVK